MKRNDKPITLILLAVCVMIWTVNVIVDIVYTARQNRFMKLSLDGLCLVVWIAAFVVNYKRYHRDDENN